MPQLRAAFLSSLLSWGATLPAGAQAPRPMEVTSDSPAYCQQLAARIVVERQRARKPAPEIDALLDRGQRLCAAGRVRPGLNRLRHALLELREHDSE